MVHNEKFSATNHRGVLIPLDDKINLEYVKFILEPLFRQAKKGRVGSDGKSNEYTALPPFMVENIEFSLPIDDYGNIDITKQKKFVEKILSVFELRKDVLEYKKQIEDLNVEIDDNYNFEIKKIENIFDIEKGKAIYTNEFIAKNKGTFSLYSSQTTNDGIIGNINSFDYNCEAITWTTDGIHAGTVFLRKGRFSMTTHCGALILKSNMKNILLDYIYSYLRNNLKLFAVGEQNKRLTTTIIKPIDIPIPVNSKGEFDLSAQQQIAEKYRKIEQIKKNILRELDKIANIEIDFE
jgi:restriction endonuclease S subunit